MDETQGRRGRAAGDRWALSVTEVADRLGISRAHAYRLVATGELPALRLGGRMVAPVRQIRMLLGEPERDSAGSAGQNATTAVGTVGASASGHLDRFPGSVDAEGTGSC